MNVKKCTNEGSIISENSDVKENHFMEEKGGDTALEMERDLRSAELLSSFWVWRNYGHF